MAEPVGVPFEVTARALARFGGVARRFDVRGRHGGITLVDDYAHLPGKIAAVLAAAAASGDGWQRVVAVFQPNRYNRMAMHVARVRATPSSTPTSPSSPTSTRPARPRSQASPGKLVVDAVCDAHPEQRVVWLPQRAELVAFLARRAAPRRRLHLDGLR